MAESTTRRRAVRGERLGGYIYGTIVVLATLIAAAKAYEVNLSLGVVLVGLKLWVGRGHH